MEICQPTIRSVSVSDDRCGSGIGDLFIDADGDNLEYTLSSGTDEMVSSEPYFLQLDAGSYTLSIKNTVTTCEMSYSGIITINDLCEVCGSGTDDDGDGYIDCEDSDCQPLITDIDVSPAICGESTGVIIITAQGQNLRYRLNGGTSQAASQFTQLAAGAYTIEVSNSVTGCSTRYPYEITVENSCEILANGIDDDGDGDIDCEDSEHYAVIRVLDVGNSACDVEDGFIQIEGDGESLSYQLSGTYELIKDDIQNYQAQNTTGSFTDLPPGNYTLTVTNGVSGCTAVREVDLYRSCEICGNDIDDDGDGYEDCDDVDCMLAAIGLNAKGDRIQKSDPEDICEVLTEDEIEAIRSLRESNLLVHTKFNANDLIAECIDGSTASHHFMTPDGRLIEINKVNQLGFISPSSPHYEQMKYFVTAILTNEGEYYQAVIEKDGTFRDYYKYDVATSNFVKPLSRLSPFFFILSNDADYANATIALDAGDNCTIEYFCLNQWRDYSLDQAALGGDKVISYLNDVGDYTRHIVSTCEETQVNDILILANGFRIEPDIALVGLLAAIDSRPNSLDAIASGISFKSETAPGSVWYHDPFNYWNVLPGKMKERLKPSTTLYVDGHAHINTSNHIDERRFAVSLLSWALFSAPNPPTNTAPILNDSPADGMPGFITRREKGKIAGTRIAEMIESGEIEVDYESDSSIVQKIDLVAHSMGYAYALGVMDGVKESGLKIGFDRFYILAAENACSIHGTFDQGDFGEVWQYGSRGGAIGGNDNPFIEQDGVAPQCGILDLPDSRRSYIPPQLEVDFNKNFLNSHSEGNYGWIFSKPKKGENGFITKK